MQRSGQPLDGIVLGKHTSTTAWTRESSSGTQQGSHYESENIKVSYPGQLQERSFVNKIVTFPIRIISFAVQFYFRTVISLIPKGVFPWIRDVKDRLIAFQETQVTPFIAKLMAYPVNVIIPWVLRQPYLAYVVPYALWKVLVDYFGREEYSWEEIQYQTKLAQAGGIVTSLLTCVVPYAVMNKVLMHFVVDDNKVQEQNVVESEKDTLIRQIRDLEKKNDIQMKKLRDLEAGWNKAQADLAAAKGNAQKQEETIQRLRQENFGLQELQKTMQRNQQAEASNMADMKTRMQNLEQELQKLQAGHAAELTNLESRLREENDRKISELNNQRQAEVDQAVQAGREALEREFEQQLNDLREVANRASDEKRHLEEVMQQQAVSAQEVNARLEELNNTVSGLENEVKTKNELIEALQHPANVQ